VEKENKVTNDDVVHRFMNMEGKGHRFDLNFSMIHYIHCFLLWIVYFFFSGDSVVKDCILSTPTIFCCYNCAICSLYFDKW
jgi:hypothetical protein